MRTRLRLSGTPPFLRSAVAALLTAVTLPVGSQPLPAAGSELETITVYARRMTPVSRVAATVTVIDQARIETTLATDIRDLVRYEPGLSVRNDPFRFGLDTITVRGLGGNRVAVEVDGIPAAGGFAVGSYADTGRVFVDPAFVDRVEFLRGPASSLYGSDAIGGVVAMTTLTPGRLLATTPRTTVGGPLRWRRARQDPHAGCSAWHGGKGTRPIRPRTCCQTPVTPVATL
jgi:hemoglobin/transferrin/lactoferrin receptor protein